MNKIRVSFIVVSLMILIVVNSVFYVTTKNTLINHQNEKIELIINNVKSSIESTNQAETYFHYLLARGLQKASVAIKNALPPDINQVKSEQLVELAEELDLEGISLFVQKDNDIVVEKSSSPKEVGLSTKDWNEWYIMFSQLMEEKNVKLIPGFGEKLPNFWSGPIDTSTANPELITKWGYFYDGTTNYMINPYVDDELIKGFQKSAGIERTILRNIGDNPFLLEVSVLNSRVLKEGEKTHKDTNVVWLSDRMLVYGSYKYKEDKDKGNTIKAIETFQPVTEISVFNNKKVLKHYIPVSFKGRDVDNLKDDMVIIVTSDYEVILDSLNKKILNIFLTGLACLILGYIIIYYLILTINRKERTIFNIQEVYSKQIDTLYRTVRENKHDSTHHLFTISGLAHMKMYDELQDYVDNLLELKTETNDIVNISIPAFSGLIQAKIAEAIEKQISFQHHFERFENLQLDMMKVTNLVRIIGNILDNAFHAVLENEEGNRTVVITGRFQSGQMTISIYNNGTPIPVDNLKKIFYHGFTTRKDRGGNGLGLSSSKKIIEGYKGKIKVTSDEDWTRFTIQLPVSSKEVIAESKEAKPLINEYRKSSY
jgi:Histidine kinase-, DNA gyrase B-, and HSP90-like ATPase